jgi:hypothetical protein
VSAKNQKEISLEFLAMYKGGRIQRTEAERFKRIKDFNDLN